MATLQHRTYSSIGTRRVDTIHGMCSNARTDCVSNITADPPESAGKSGCPWSCPGNARDNLHGIGFTALGNELAGAGSASIQVRLDIGLRQGQPSITQKMAGPWDSPKSVTEKSCPKVLPIMKIINPEPRPTPGHTGGKGQRAVC